MNQICPINERTTNAQGVQINAFFVFLILITYFFFPKVEIFWFLFLDFSLKIFLQKSLLSLLSNKICWKKNQINSAPKEFANKIGLFFITFSLIFIYLNLETPFNIFYFMFLGAVSLEAFFSFCVGCLLYTILKKIKLFH